MGTWGGANRPVTSNKLGIPTKADGADGDLQIRQTQLGAKLFGKIGGRWYDNPFSVDGITKIGTNLSEHLSISSDGIEIVKVKIDTIDPSDELKKARDDIQKEAYQKRSETTEWNHMMEKVQIMKKKFPGISNELAIEAVQLWQKHATKDIRQIKIDDLKTIAPAIAAILATLAKKK